jgi:hypothetical protein
MTMLAMHLVIILLTTLPQCRGATIRHEMRIVGNLKMIRYTTLLLVHLLDTILRFDVVDAWIES